MEATITQLTRNSVFLFLGSKVCIATSIQLLEAHKSIKDFINLCNFRPTIAETMITPGLKPEVLCTYKDPPKIFKMIENVTLGHMKSRVRYLKFVIKVRILLIPKNRVGLTRDFCASLLQKEVISHELTALNTTPYKFNPRSSL